MRHHADVAGIIFEMALQPSDRLRIKVVGRFIEKKQVWLFKQQAGERQRELLGRSKESRPLIEGQVGDHRAGLREPGGSDCRPVVHFESLQGGRHIAGAGETIGAILG